MVFVCKQYPIHAGVVEKVGCQKKNLLKSKPNEVTSDETAKN